MDSKYSLAVIGQPGMAEMNPLMQSLEANPLLDSEILFDNIRDYLTQSREREVYYDLVLVLQSRPREYSQEEIEKLVTSNPLTRFLCCYSSWCESDGRNYRDEWPVAVHVSIREALPRIEKLISNLEGNEDPVPLTSGREELFEALSPSRFHCPAIIEEHSVLVQSPDLEFKQMLSELLREISPHLQAEPNPSNPSLCLWDADPLNENQVERLKEFRASFPETLLVPIMNFPQPEDLSILQNELRTTSIVPKMELCQILPRLLEEELRKQESA